MEYYTLLTNVGIAKFVAARASNTGVNLRSFKLSSKVIVPTQEMSVLEEVVYEGSITNKLVESNNPNHVIIECHIPSNVGGFEVNAIGIYDEEGELIAIGNTPRTYKPLLSEGSAKELMIKVVMEVSNASEVILKLDPSVIIASRDYVDEAEQKLETKIDESMESLNLKFSEKADLNGSANETFSVATPTEDHHAINKAILDTRLAGMGENVQDLVQNAVLLQGNQNISGVKTFGSTPVCSANPTANNQLANKAYVDAVGNSKVSLNGNQTINGVKTFSTAPMCGGIMSSGNQLINLHTLNRLAFRGNQRWRVKTYNKDVNYTNTIGPMKIISDRPLYINGVLNDIQRFNLDNVNFNKGNSWGPFTNLFYLVERVIPYGATYKFGGKWHGSEWRISRFSVLEFS
ncbi:phage tail protein [Helicobacter apodemus]|uniref:Phage tail protein n=1 Tax=Helicobacter apodemus TaxID=135569 RepID=A0A4U8UED2_9HELI|nr:phage tail protein [Helicobacter apodemus]TLE14467.1 phage tail protein [Helicobacter apodemus]